MSLAWTWWGNEPKSQMNKKKKYDLTSFVLSPIRIPCMDAHASASGTIRSATDNGTMPVVSSDVSDLKGSMHDV